MIEIFELDNKNKEAEKLKKVDFKNEKEIENILEENPSIVSSSIIIARQGQLDFAGSKHIPDLIGVDEEGRIQVIELKNNQVSLDILPQVLRYQSSAKEYPSDIRLLWERFNDRPKGLELDTKLSPEIIIAAPSISRELKDTVTSMSMEFRLVEISKFKKEENIIVVSRQIEQREMERKSPSKGYEKGWAAFKNRKGASEEEIELMKYIANELTDFFEDKGWNIEMNFKQNYIAFQYGGNLNVATMKRRKGRVRIKIKTGTKPSKLKIEIPDNWGLEWDEKHKEIIIHISSKDLDMELIGKLLGKAYSYVK